MKSGEQSAREFNAAHAFAAIRCSIGSLYFNIQHMTKVHRHIKAATVTDPIVKRNRFVPLIICGTDSNLSIYDLPI
jgi:hypothetical protein